MSEQINRVLADRPQSFTTAEQLQARTNIGAQASGDYAFNSALSAKLDASASSLFQPSGNYQTAGDYAYNSALSAKLDATASSMFQPSGNYAYSSSLSAKQDTAGMTAYVPYSAIECDTASSVTSIGGSAVGAGFSGVEHDSNLSGDGTTASPLGIKNGFVLKSASNSMTGNLMCDAYFRTYDSYYNYTATRDATSTRFKWGTALMPRTACDLTYSSLRIQSNSGWFDEKDVAVMECSSLLFSSNHGAVSTGSAVCNLNMTSIGFHYETESGTGYWPSMYANNYEVSVASGDTATGERRNAYLHADGAAIWANDSAGYARETHYHIDGLEFKFNGGLTGAGMSAGGAYWKRPGASASLSPNGLTASNSAGYTGSFQPSGTEIRCSYGGTSVATGRLLHNGVEFYVVLPGDVPEEHCYFSPAGIHGCGSFGDRMYTDSWVSAKRYEGTADSGNSMTVDIGHATAGGVVRFPSITMGVPSASSTIHMSSIPYWNGKLDSVDVGYGLEGDGRTSAMAVTGASGRWDGMHNRYTMDLSADGLRVSNYDLDYSATRKQIAVGNGGVRLSACDTAGAVSSLVRLEEGIVDVNQSGVGNLYINASSLRMVDTAFNFCDLTMSSLKALSAMYDWCTSQGMTPIV